MTTMKKKKKTTPLTEREIDDAVVAEADDDAAWGKPVRARKAKPTSVPLSARVATRAAFFARLHREKAWTGGSSESFETASISKRPRLPT